MLIELFEKQPRKYGETFHFIALSGDFRIYERRQARPNPDMATQFEIVKPIPKEDGLHYPSASQWGIYGWTCMGERSLVAQMKILLDNTKTKHVA